MPKPRLFAADSALCTSEGDDLHESDMGSIQCRVPYGGSDVPEVDFYDEGQLLPKEVATGSDHVTISSNMSVSADDDDKEFECRVKLQEPKYEDGCHSTLNVTCK